MHIATPLHETQVSRAPLLNSTALLKHILRHDGDETFVGLGS